jgi:DNA modification methylase
MPAFTDGRAHLHVGHVLDVLAACPAACFHSIACSPPYWALRAYGTAPQVWYGHHGIAHAHSWQPDALPPPMKTGGPTPKQVSNQGSQAANEYRDAFRNGKLYEDHQLDNAAMGGATCTICGAWRGELGSEPTIDLYVAHMVELGRALWRVLRPDGTWWLNLSDTYASSAPGTTNVAPTIANGAHYGTARAVHRPETPSGLKPKDLIGIPWRVALALQAAGWYLRAEVIWAKPNPMPESITDRPARAHETIFLLARSERYYYDAEAVREPALVGSNRKWGVGAAGGPSVSNLPKQQSVENGRNLRSVWSIPTQPQKGDHYATFPEQLVARMILAGTSATGCCSDCGAPWQRVVNISGGLIGQSFHDHTRDAERGHNGGKSSAALATYRRQTTGWEPTCACHDATIEPCRVLDPFAGSGTTLYVARGLGRDAWGIELNPKYAQDAWDRVKLGSAAASRAGR